MKRNLNLVLVAVLSLLIIFLMTGCTKDVENQQLDYELQNGSIIKTYTGTLIDNEPDGDCVATISTDGVDWEYSGTITDGLMSGEATAKNMPFCLEFQDGSYTGVYSGTLTDALPNGTGSFSYEDKDEYLDYDGMWSSGKISGDGTLQMTGYTITLNDGSNRTGVYDGQVLDGIANGSGTYSTKNTYGEPYTYSGGWANGLFDGYGKCEYPESDGIEEGNYKDGAYYPTYEQLLVQLGTSIPKYTLSEEQIARSKELSEALGATDAKVELIEENTDRSIEYDMYTKSPQKYTQSIMAFEGYTVIQIEEMEYPSEVSDILTYMTIEDPETGDVCFVYFFGSIDGLYEDDSVDVYGYPLGYSSYQSVSNEIVKCIVVEMYSVNIYSE